MITLMRSRQLPVLIILGLAGFPGLLGCRSAQPLGEADFGDANRQAVEVVLDDFHLAASQADGERYFGHMTEDMVFLGTDATERWTKQRFQLYVQEHFSRGQGWTYRPLDRHVFLGPGPDTAWFDERLMNEKYGECRGTGALRRIDGVWYVAQYNLTLPVPNDVAPEVLRLIREHAVEAAARRR